MLWRDIPRSEFYTIRQVVRQVCRFSPMDEPEVLSRTLERMSRWYDPESDTDVTLVQATRRMATLAHADVRSEAPPEVPVDLESSDWENLTPLWIKSEEVMPEEDLARSDHWVELVGSVVAGVGVRSATVIEMMFRGRLKQNEIANVLGISPPAVHKHWSRARAYLRDILTPPEPAKERKTLRSGAWGVVRGVVHH